MSIVEKIGRRIRGRRAEQRNRDKVEGLPAASTLLMPGVEQRVTPRMTRDIAEVKFFSDVAIERFCRQFPNLSREEIAQVVSGKRSLLDSAKVYDHLGALIERDLLDITSRRRSR